MSENPAVSPLPSPAQRFAGYAEVLVGGIGCLALFAAASAFGMLEVHSSTDTWIGLAAGRQILTSPEFPTQDTFSYTFDGKVWFNQNWLTHVWQYWLYSRFGEDYVVYGTWAMCVFIFFFSYLACLWRSGHWLGSAIAASVVAFGCRDFVSARPATTGFFCLSALWALICALEGQQARKRWWPIVALLPLMLIWGNAHGSFVFAYGILFAYVGHWLVIRYIANPILGIVGLVLPIVGFLIAAFAMKQPNAIVLVPAYGAYWGLTYWLRPKNVISSSQVIGICTAAAVAVALTMVVSPYHIGNFTHPGKVAGSEVFRNVSEWHPAFDFGPYFPPVRRFFWILGGSLTLLAAAWAARTAAAVSMDAGGVRSAGSPSGPAARHTSLFDASLVIVGLAMTIWARRFAPMYFLFGAPVLLVWILNLTAWIGEFPRRLLRYGAIAMTFVAAAVIGDMTYRRGVRELVTAFEDKGREFTLLERVSRFDSCAIEAMEFISRNELEVKLFCEWTEAGVAMFRTPTAKVFIDGRSQQVYDEEHYKRYYQLLLVQRATPAQCLDEIERLHTDCVILRHTPKAMPLINELSRSPGWVTVVPHQSSYAIYTLFLQRGSPAFTHLSERVRAGTAWFPNTAFALVGRGYVCAAMTPPDLEGALKSWKQAVRAYLPLGVNCYGKITQVYLRLNRVDEAIEYVNRQNQLVSAPGTELDEQQKTALQAQLQQCASLIQSTRRQSGSAGESNP